MPTFGSLFAGIGGIDLGLERAGWTGRWQVEWDGYCQRVLAKHWPDVPRVGDIHDAHAAWECPTLLADAERDGRGDQSVDGGQPGEGGAPASERQGRRVAAKHDRLAGQRLDVRHCPGCLEPVDLIAGGFPCQPFSVAGKRLGKEDERWLWPEFARVIRELRPRYVLVENVPGLLARHGGMGAVLGDLAELGYDAEWDSIPAAAVGAPHLRYRVWIVATDARGKQYEGAGDAVDWPSAAGLPPRDIAGTRPQEAGAEPDGAGDRAMADAAGYLGDGRDDHPRGGSEPRIFSELGDGGYAPRPFGGWWEPEPDVGRVAHGVPARVDRLRALGNAVVPQVVEAIGRRLLEDVT